MKRFLVAILCFIMGCVGLIGCAKEPEPAPTPTVEKSITYYAVIDNGTSKEKTSIPAGMYKEDGKYPTKYVVGTGATISSLVDYEENNFKYTFGGWFADEALSTELEKIEKTADSDVSVYAKITRTVVETEPVDPEAPTPVFSSIEYQYVLDDASAVMGHYTLLLDTDKTYPNTYEEGKTLEIPEYVNSKTIEEDGKNIKYTFVDWYIDAACTTAFDGTIPATQKGKVILYAKITRVDVTPVDDDWTKNY